MKYFIILLLFFIYSFSLFLIDNILILEIIFLFNIVISLLIKIPLKKHFLVLTHNILFVIFIVGCNILFMDINASLKVGIRLFLAIDYTYIMGKYFNPTTIRIAFYYLLYPLKIFKVDINSLTLIITIALSFIPILIDEAKMIKFALKSKGFEFNLKNLVTKPHIYLITFLNNLFERMEELEKTLIMKAY